MEKCGIKVPIRLSQERKYVETLMKYKDELQVLFFLLNVSNLCLFIPIQPS
jgi:hypothetical protein